MNTEKYKQTNITVVKINPEDTIHVQVVQGNLPKHKYEELCAKIHATMKSQYPTNTILITNGKFKVYRDNK